ncbi:MAG: hypothetical protein HOH74_10725, partial [Gemmatimonadetes bacterium]|nr:hypothetical protein [Gemmatimonadota bacterium]
MKRVLLSSLLVAFTAFGEAFIVRDGKPEAEIVIAENAMRGTRLAAQELQIYVEKIAGAKLAVVTAPTNTVSVKLYVGQSPYTETLGVTTEGLKYGAYRI